MVKAGSRLTAKTRYLKVFDCRKQPDATRATTGLAIRDLLKARCNPEADAETIADSLLWSGISCQALSDFEGAEKYFSRLIETASASEEMRARARWGLGGVFAEKGESKRAAELLGEAKNTMLKIGRIDLAEKIGKRIDMLEQNGGI